MSKYFDEIMQSLLQAVEIAEGNIPVAEVYGMPAKTYRVLEEQGIDINTLARDALTDEEKKEKTARKAVKNPFAKIHQTTAANGGSLSDEIRKEMMKDAIRELHDKYGVDTAAEKD